MLTHLKIHHDDEYSDTVIISDSESVSVHTVILRNCCQLLREVLTSTGDTTIILSGGFSSSLSDFLTLLYTGTVVCYTEEECHLLLMLCTQLGMDTVIDYSLPTSDKIEISKTLK